MGAGLPLAPQPQVLAGYPALGMDLKYLPIPDLKQGITFENNEL